MRRILQRRRQTLRPLPAVLRVPRTLPTQAQPCLPILVQARGLERGLQVVLVGLRHSSPPARPKAPC